MIAQHFALDIDVGDAVEEYVSDNHIGEIDTCASCRSAASVRSNGVRAREGVVAVDYQSSDSCRILLVAPAAL